MPAVLLVLLAGACTTTPPQDEDTQPTASPTAEPTPTATSTTGLTAADEAAAAGAWERYWDARVAAYNGPNPDPALWAGFAGDEIIAVETATAQQYLDNGIVFTGDVRTWDVRVVESGGAPMVVGCVDESGWTGTMAGEPLPPREKPVHPQGFTLQRVGDAWLLLSTGTLPEGLTC